MYVSLVTSAWYIILSMLPSMGHVTGLQQLQFFLSSLRFVDLQLLMALLWLDITDLTLFMQL